MNTAIKKGEGEARVLWEHQVCMKLHASKIMLGFHKARGLERDNGAVHHLEHGSHRRAQIKKQLPEIEFGAFALIHWPSNSYSIILVI